MPQQSKVETFDTTTQNMVRTVVTWAMIDDRLKNLDSSLKYYGVPRGGQYIAARLNPVDTPEEADVIIDDCIDSGATMERYKSKYNKPFLAIFRRADEDIKEWFIFPWERDEVPAEDNFTRILQSLGQDVTREGLKDTPKRQFVLSVSETLSEINRHDLHVKLKRYLCYFAHYRYLELN